MTKLNELIQQFCPDGVEYKTLGSFATISRGGNFQKKDFRDDGFPCIHYGQIYTKYGLFVDKTVSFISPACASKQKTASKNDIIMAVTSENIEDVCKCIVWLGGGEVAVSGHSAIIRHSQNPKYLAYYFHSRMFFDQKRKLAHGTKVIEVTPDKLASVKIPLPPIEVQREIVRILDDFTEQTEQLKASLTAELTARKKQYEYYRDKLLTFGDDVPYRQIKDICDIVDYRGKTPTKTSSGVFLVTAKNIRKGYIDYEKSQEYISASDYDDVMRRGIPKIGDVLITTEAPCGNVAQVDREGIALAQRVIKYRPKSEIINSAYLKYVLLGKEFQSKLNAAATGGTVKGIKGSKLHKLTIPVPSIDAQEKVVSLLESFDVPCNDLTSGLPAEIAARQKQYEYYRDKLLTFKEAKA